MTQTVATPWRVTPALQHRAQQRYRHSLKRRLRAMKAYSDQCLRYVAEARERIARL
jgi:hypothetical protein